MPNAYEAYASVHGLFVPDGFMRDRLPVEFEPNLELCEPEEQITCVMYQSEAIHRFGGRLFADRVTAIRHTYALPDDEAGRVEAMRSANRLLLAVLECFRLYKRGTLYLGGICSKWTRRCRSISPTMARESIRALPN